MRRSPHHVTLGEADPNLTPRAGLRLVAELDRVLGIVATLDREIGKTRPSSRRSASSAPAQAELSRSWIANQKHLEAIVTEMEELSARAGEILLRQAKGVWSAAGSPNWGDGGQSQAEKCGTSSLKDRFLSRASPAGRHDIFPAQRIARRADITVRAR